MTDRSFEAANDRSRGRLLELIGSLDATALATDTGEGWTVSTVLAHVAFWDLHTAVAWQNTGDRLTPAEWSDEGSRLVNDALEPLLRAISGPDAAGLAVAAAIETDARLARLPDAAVDAIRLEGRDWFIDGSDHGQDHIEQIERGLGRR